MTKLQINTKGEWNKIDDQTPWRQREIKKFKELIAASTSKWENGSVDTYM
jgi:hypothetical protein